MQFINNVNKKPEYFVAFAVRLCGVRRTYASALTARRLVFGLFVHVIILSLCYSLVLAPKHVFAAEDEKKADGGEGEKRADGADREWAKRTTKLNVLQAKIKDLETNIANYIRAKNGNYASFDEKGNKIDVIKKIAEAYKELEKTTSDYNRAKDELTYRFPEEGVLIERRYVPLRVQTIEQIEKESGLNGDLTRTKEAIDKKYDSFRDDRKVVPKQPDQPESTLKDTKTNDESPDQPQRLKLSQ